jgi:3',5'-cyclic AMP phosphodiesterase CpdA
MEPTATSGEAILHLSDLHFGDFHGFPTSREKPGRGVDIAPLSELISNYIRGKLGIHIGVLVVSGDLISKGASKAYVDARDFLEHLIFALGLERKHCVLIPGNHDIWTMDAEHPTRDYAHERPYRDFLEAFFKADFRNLERVRRYRTPSGRDLIFIELNSARIRSDQLKEYGYVAKHRYERLLGFIAERLKQESGASEPVFFAVLHHHILPISAVDIPDDKRPVSLCLDAGELMDEFQSFGIQFVLHGHQHAPFIGTVSRLPSGFNDGEYPSAPLYVIGCGSSGGKRAVLPRNLDSNTFGIYVPSGDKLEVYIEKYTDLTTPTRFRHVKLPIRKWLTPL